MNRGIEAYLMGTTHGNSVSELGKVGADSWKFNE